MELTVDGKGAHASTGGRAFDPGLPTIVFVHGAGLDHSVWALQSRYLAHHGWGVLALDLPGHGRSEGPPLATIAELSGWLLRFLDAAGVKSATLVGHSMGSLTVLETAGRAADRVAALVVVGISLPMAVNDDLLAAAKANDHLASDLIVGWGYGRAAHLGGHPAPGLWMMGDGLRLLEKAADGVLYNDLAACNDYRDGDEAAAGVRCPTLLVLGDGDIMTPPRRAQGLAAAISESRTVVIKDCGHMVMVERPDELLDALREFV
jgi:pimeloyl-ACP methyl ester carboxylesterase